MMERWRCRVAMVTGASMGVGEAIVRELVKHGMKVVAAARSYDKLTALSQELNSSAAGDNPGEVFPVKCDLSNEEDIKAMFAAVKERWGGVDALINNAGINLNVDVISGASDDMRHMWEVNVMAVCLCSQAAVRSMRERGVDDGQLININSLSGHRVGTAHFYSITKFALTALTECVRWELRGIDSHIRISSISPGLIQSNFHSNFMAAEKVESLYERQCLQPKDMADSVVYILSTPQHVQVHDILVRPTEQIP